MGASAGLLHQPHSTGCSHSLMLPGDFNFIYKQDENPSSINLGEQKKGLKKNHGVAGQRVGEHPEEEEEEVGRASIPPAAECASASLQPGSPFLPAPWLAARQHRGHWSDFTMSPGALSGHRYEECMNLLQSTSHLHRHQSEEAFNSPVQSPLRISSLSGGHLHSRWAGWWPKTGACPTAKTRACG